MERTRENVSTFMDSYKVGIAIMHPDMSYKATVGLRDRFRRRETITRDRHEQ